MIDTITLVLNRQDFKIIDGSSFNPPLEILAKRRFGRQHYLKSVLNPPKSGYKRVYMPFLTYYVRRSREGVKSGLKVEFNAPKLLFLNNLQEVAEEDFELIVTTLLKRLKQMGVLTSADILKNAEVSYIHFCKNIELDNFYSASYLISRLARFDVPKHLDLNNKRFDNYGRALYLYSKTNSFIIYDKINDLNLPGNRGTDRNKTLFQKSLFNYLEKEKKPLEVPRLEVRINNKRKLASILKKSNVYVESPKLKLLFKKEVSQKVLKHYWNTYFRDSRYRFLLTRPKKADELTFEIIRFLKNQESRSKSNRIQYKNAFSLLGFYVYAQQHGIKTLRNAIETNFCTDTWGRASKDYEILSEILNNDKNRDEVFEYIEKALDKFEVFKPDLSTINVN